MRLEKVNLRSKSNLPLRRVRNRNDSPARVNSTQQLIQSLNKYQKKKKYDGQAGST